MSDDSGLVTITGHQDFGKTVDDVCAAVAAMGYHVFAQVDHTDNAVRAGRELPPTTLVLFGEPTVGTDLIAERRTEAIDLPSKILVWQDADAVRLTYNTADWLVRRHGVEREGAAAAQVLEETTEKICRQAASARP
ncbi:DUF302 domain-containing protein [Nonomuraea sp. MCN248]|uniref:DUF302 domain-containing protein n=1 Tax=Nonomuraea corallina TaxID=2989783 RepID=A0ABT4S3N7_9ACTN|nr:DUF302 domain-containing protein [Nonomuraea corallina]MDA0631813.1 DUF302 domain-containing protein [Nonomuraea corallina]